MCHHEIRIGMSSVNRLKVAALQWCRHLITALCLSLTTPSCLSLSLFFWNAIFVINLPG